MPRRRRGGEPAHPGAQQPAGGESRPANRDANRPTVRLAGGPSIRSHPGTEAGGEARQQRRLHGRLQGLVRGQSRKISVPTALGAGEQLAPRPALRLRPAIQSGTARVEQMKELSWPHRRASRGGRRRVRPRGRASSRGGSAALASAVPPARGSKHRAPGPPLLPPTPPNR